MTDEKWENRTGLLPGAEKLEKLHRARVLVVGLGGVGAYAAENICRAGVGKMTIVDGDRITPGNRNRQLLALTSADGKLKAEIMANRLQDINLSIKTGPTMSALGLKEGIHWHINPDVKIEYIATSAKRDTIPWVRYTNLKTNQSFVYEDTDYPIGDIEKYKDQIRTMDCIDCHNRPSHHYRYPVHFVDDAITAGKISKELPEIKMLCMQILANKFSTTDSAMAFIEKEMLDFYSSGYPEIMSEKKELVTNAITALQTEFQKNIFPEMGVTWDVYPSFLGHVETLGCDRCHNERHVNAENRVISRDCNLCHEITAQGPPDSIQMATSFKGLEFRHPVDIGDDWKVTLCSECHQTLY